MNDHPLFKHVLATFSPGRSMGRMFLLHEVSFMANSNKNQGSDNRGFASMGDDKQREIASEGGRAAHASGNAHEFDSQEAREAGRKGGEAVSEDREHMSEIGKKGGEASRGGSSESRSASSGSNNASGNTRGGSSEQHAEAGRQSHKNT